MKTIRIPFSFSVCVKKIHNGITYVFNTWLIEGWAKKKGNLIIADIDKVYLDQKEVKGDLETMEGIDNLEEAADSHVRDLFDANNLKRA